MGSSRSSSAAYCSALMPRVKVKQMPHWLIFNCNGPSKAFNRWKWSGLPCPLHSDLNTLRIGLDLMSLLNNLGTYKTDGVERCHLTCLSPYGGLHFEGWALAGASMRFCQLLIIRAWTCKGEQCANWIKLRDVFCVLSLFFRIVPPSAPGPEAPSLAHSRKLDVNDSKFCSYSLIAYQMMISHWHILCIYIYI